MTSLRNPIAHTESNTFSTNSKLNWLRAAVLGANDGIVSVSSVIVGVAGASHSKVFVMTAGLAALVAGALSMAVGEYVSVSAQRDTERALLRKERIELDNLPEQELEELVTIYQGKGLSRKTAEVVAIELTEHDAFAAHVDAELNINPNDLTNPWHAAGASGAAFFAGAVIPILAVLFSSASMQVYSTFASVIVALIITGTLSAYVGGANKTNAVIRVVFGGLLAMVITFGMGKIFGVAGI
ncbi:MAG: VIT family protein [Candidatus Pacebacteria bacterium]|nr:VIT family protein [Candidatus Paceibacterota bacterium]